jgi:hypothetical protein
MFHVKHIIAILENTLCLLQKYLFNGGIKKNIMIKIVSRETIY